ncbi:excalibur calcium-binding domain-containing protein [Rhodococcus sp. NPDC059968]|uniref:excalibur calcium-binding domain-containing protein n=1 Tax=Rhodococcus sp. NPDC059968 TaxID=3347017 RepID=UPI00366B0F7B
MGSSVSVIIDPSRQAAARRVEPRSDQPLFRQSRYASCADAKAAGAAPIYQGEPGYSTKLDRDKDGIACDK